MVKNCLVAQSGGPTAAINASLSGVIHDAKQNPEIQKVYGGLHGIFGILHRDIVDLGRLFTTDAQFDQLASTPAMALGSCRHKLPPFCDQPEIYERIRDIFREYNIGYFFYIGGNDSMDTARKLADYFALIEEPVQVLGIPKTIDNDLMGTDHTPGFGSAAKFIATSLCEIARDCEVYPVASVTLVEIMGRNAGWLTASAALARTVGNRAPQLLYLPEVAFSPERFLEEIRAAHRRHKAVVIAVSEGIRLQDGRYVGETDQSGATDVFGHRYLSGTGRYLERLVAEHIGCKVRSVELNVLQRCCGHLLSKTDIDESRKLGEAAVRFALQGKSGGMVGLCRKSNSPYQVEPILVPLGEVANLERPFPTEWILPSGSDITAQAIDYLLPLIQGEVPSLVQNGLPVHFRLDKAPVLLEK